MAKNKNSNILETSHKFYKILLAGAVYLGICILVAGSLLRSLMVKEVASLMGSRMADLYSSAETQRMRNISVSLVQEATNLELLNPGDRKTVLSTLQAAALSIEEVNQCKNVEVFALIDGQFFTTDSTMSEEFAMPWIQNSNNGVTFLDLDGRGSEGAVVPVVYVYGQNAIGYVFEPQSISDIVSLESMIDRSMFLLCDTKFDEVLCQSKAGTCTGPAFLSNMELSGLKEVNDSLNTDQGDLRSTILKRNGEDYHAYFRTLDNGWTCVLVFPQSALLEKCKSWWTLYYLWVVALLVLLIVVGWMYSRRHNLSRTERILSSMTKSFEAGYFIDLKEERYAMIRAGDDFSDFPKGNLRDLDLLWAQFLIRFVVPKDRDPLDHMFNKDQIAKNMTGRTGLSCDFEHTQKGWCRLVCTPVDKDKNGKVQSVLLTMCRIDEEKKLELSLKRENEDLQEVLTATAKMFDRFFIVDLLENTYTYSYVKGVDTRGLSVGPNGTLEEFETDCNDRFTEPDSNRILNRPFTAVGIREILKNRDDFYMEYRDRNYPEQYLSTTMFCIEREDGVPSKVVYAVRDIAESKQTEEQYKKVLKEANEKLQELADHDVLTGLLNRRGLLHAVKNQRYANAKVGLIILDVDKFKTVNDTYGHQVGDAILQDVANGLTNLFRSDDLIVRLGGDEFMVLLLDCDKSHSDMIKNKMRMLNVRLAKPAEDRPVVSVSAGAAFSRPNESENLYRRADDQLYKVKENKRGGCFVDEN